MNKEWSNNTGEPYYQNNNRPGMRLPKREVEDQKFLKR